MSGQTLPAQFENHVEFTIPGFHMRPPIKLHWSKISEGEKRLVEARVVNPGTYSDLEFTFNEGYREAKANLSAVGYEITQADKVLRKLKSEFLLDKYPDFLKETKIKDSAAIREAFLEKHEEYVDAKDRIDMLVALESLLDGKVKVFENVCRYMKKQMDLTLRSGVDPNKYIR